MSLDVAQCFQAFRTSVYRWAFALLGRQDEALDVTQDVFLRLLREQVSFEHAAPARAWLRTTTTRIVYDLSRSRRARRTREARHVVPRSEHPSAEQAERVERLRSGFNVLSDQQRLVLICKCYDDMTFAQIAAELGVSVPTIKTHYLRALESLRNHMRESEPERLP